MGIIITTIFNNHKSQRDYWSSNELLRCNPIASAMSRDKFLEIKRNIKLNKLQDKNEHHKVWRVRNILNIFRKNILQFGFFSTALSIDEMMVKFHGRAPVLQFMPNKPERFGIKIWAVCSPEGYLFDLDVYCGQGYNIYSSDNKMKLAKCAMGSRVVMLMVQQLLLTVSPKNYVHITCILIITFANPDLLVHLNEVGLIAIGTVRSDRVKEKKFTG